MPSALARNPWNRHAQQQEHYRTQRMPMKPEGLIMRWSQYGPTETMDRLVDAAVQHGMTVFARIDHAAMAAEAGLQLKPREVLLFGSPPLVTPILREYGTLAIDLPLKAMVWQDDSGKTCLAYYDPAWLAMRHGLSQEFADLFQTVKSSVTTIVQRATRGPVTEPVDDE
jgi:uncharacterized protein (DUF302 family)